MRSTPEHAPQLAPGADFAERYQVIRRLRQGGMGSVYEVLDRTTDRLRALKVMQPEIAADDDLRTRFEQEASIVGRVRSDHIVEVVDAGVSEPDNTPFLVMELLHGDDLGRLLVQEGRFGAEQTVRILSQAAMGLDKVHAEGVIHRDLKPENLFVSTRDDGEAHVKILDFGVAKVIGPLASLSTTRSLGTPLYMAPEQLTGDGTIGESADLYSLAQVAFCMLVGKPYWFDEARSATNVYSFITKVVDGMVEPARERARRCSVTLPAAFDPWFEKAAAQQADQRFESAHEQVASLAGALGVSPPRHSSAPQPTAGSATPAALAVGLATTAELDRATPGRGWWPGLRPLAIGATLGLLALVVLLLMSSETAPDQEESPQRTSASATGATASASAASAALEPFATASAAQPSDSSLPVGSATQQRPPAPRTKINAPATAPAHTADVAESSGDPLDDL